jgi:putative transposase
MPRHPRLFVPRATYHVYCRVARGEFVFDDDEEAIEFIEVLRRVRDLDGWTILAWCLMGNHYHLVLTTDEVDLWRSMARLQATVSRNFNRQHRYLGRLWQSRYRARVITTDEYFRQVVAYVHLNPVSAGIVDDPSRYSYSGHREILGLCQPHVVDRSTVLSAFFVDDETRAVDEYLYWVRAVAEAKWAGASCIRELPWWESAVDVDEIADIFWQTDKGREMGLYAP